MGDYIKEELMQDQWAIAAFKMTRSRRFDDRRKGFGKLGGKGYDWDLDEDISKSAAEECSLRFVRVRGDDSYSDSSSSSSSSDSSDSSEYTGDGNIKVVDNDYELER